MPENNTINLLWTGGWDSTFRLLEIAWCHQKSVRPWYVVDRDRASTPTEIETMERIRRAVAERNPEAGAKIGETRFIEREEILPDEEIEALFAESRLGSQYGWLPRFAKQHRLTGLEMGSVAVEGGRMYTLLRDNVERCESPAGATYRVVAAPKDKRALLFRHFSFPILMSSKEELRQRAEACGFLDVMHLTWTCHTPRRGRPCGTCTPCMVMMQSSQAWRIPPARRIRPLLRLAKARVRRITS